MISSFFLLFLLEIPLPAAQQSPQVADTLQALSSSFYRRMTKDEFLYTMIPKEKLLLDLGQDVTKEINERRSEGMSMSDLGLTDLATPQEQVLSDYQQELQRVVALMDDIQSLEREAQRTADLNILKMLEKLKDRLREILSTSNLQAQMDTSSTAQAQEQAARSPDESEEPEERVTTEMIKTIYERWQDNRILQYKVTLARYEFLRTRLLKSATPEQEDRMFKQALMRALTSYNSGDFELARLQLRDLIKNFEDGRRLDDIRYFAAEAAYGLNLFDEALQGYSRLTELYPTSSYYEKALIKQLFIHFICTRYDELDKTYSALIRRRANLTESQLGIIGYLTAYVHFMSGDYQKTLSALSLIPAGTEYFYPARYLSASCYANIDQQDMAIPVLRQLADEPNPGDRDQVLAQIKNNSLLKLGLIYYEKGQNELAGRYFDQVSQNFSLYDLSLMGKAWSAYRSGRPGEALKSVEEVLRLSLISNYAFEARVLAARSKELLGQSEEAVNDLMRVYEAGSQPESGATQSRLDELSQNQQDVLNSSEKQEFIELENIRSFFQSGQQEEMIGQALSAENQQYARETDQIRQKIANLDTLEQVALRNRDNKSLSDIRDLRAHLIKLLNDHTARFSVTPEDPHEDPLIRRMGMSEYMRYMFGQLLAETLTEKEKASKKIGQARRILASGDLDNRFDQAIQLEIELEETEDYFDRLNQYEIWLRENMPGDIHMDLERWASFSGYGISSINFSRIKECEQRIEKISSIIQTMDKVYQEKRREMDNRIQGLLMDVADIEKQMRLDADRRAMKEKERFFNVDYFDKRSKEAATENMKMVEEEKSQKEKEKK